ncbi:hypothetical protein D3C73_1132730 [compost metagenome]
MVFRRFAHNNGAGDHRQIARRGELPRCIQTVDGFKMGVLQTELGALLIHQFDECGLTARHVVRHGYAGVVAGVNDNAAAEIANRDPVTGLQEHQRRAFEHRIALRPSIFTHRYHVIQTNLVLIERVINHQPGHQFGQAGRITPLIGIFLCQYLASGVIHQHVRGGVYRRRGIKGKVEWRICRLYRQRQQNSGDHRQY